MNKIYSLDFKLQKKRKHVFVLCVQWTLHVFVLCVQWTLHVFVLCVQWTLHYYQSFDILMLHRVLINDFVFDSNLSNGINHDVFLIKFMFAPGFVNYKKGSLDSKQQVIKFTSCLPMVGGSLRLTPPLKLVAMI